MAPDLLASVVLPLMLAVIGPLLLLFTPPPLLPLLKRRRKRERALNGKNRSLSL